VPESAAGRVNECDSRTRGRPSPSAQALQFPAPPEIEQAHFAQENIMVDTVRGKIEDAGDAAKDAAKKAGEKVRQGADKLAKKAAGATHAAGQAAKDAGQKLKDKSGA